MCDLLRAAALILVGLSAGSAFSTTESDIDEDDWDHRWRLTLVIVAIAGACAIVSVLLTCSTQ